MTFFSNILLLLNPCALLSEFLGLFINHHNPTGKGRTTDHSNPNISNPTLGLPGPVDVNTKSINAPTNKTHTITCNKYGKNFKS